MSRYAIRQFWDENKTAFYAVMASLLAATCSVMLMTNSPGAWDMLRAMILLTFSLFVVGFEVLPHMEKRQQSNFERWVIRAQRWLCIFAAAIALMMDIFLAWLVITH